MAVENQTLLSPRARWQHTTDARSEKNATLVVCTTARGTRITCGARGGEELTRLRFEMSRVRARLSARLIRPVADTPPMRVQKGSYEGRFIDPRKVLGRDSTGSFQII